MKDEIEKLVDLAQHSRGWVFREYPPQRARLHGGLRADRDPGMAMATAPTAAHGGTGRSDPDAASDVASAARL